MTPILIITVPEHLPASVSWASQDYVVAVMSRPEDPDPLSFHEAWMRYLEMNGCAHFFESHRAAQQWADAYVGPRWLEVRAGLARLSKRPPSSLAAPFYV